MNVAKDLLKKWVNKQSETEMGQKGLEETLLVIVTEPCTICIW